MKIVKAMKKIARLQGEIKDVKHRMQNCLSTAIDNDYNESFDELKTILFAKVNELVKLKAQIMQANVNGGMFQQVLFMGEMKSYMTFLKELDPKAGIDTEHARYGAETLVKFKSQMTMSEKNKMIDNCQAEINKVTDMLDDFNATTNIVEELDVTARIV
jgi:hypothetical protein